MFAAIVDIYNEPVEPAEAEGSQGIGTIMVITFGTFGVLLVCLDVFTHAASIKTMLAR